MQEINDEDFREIMSQFRDRRTFLWIGVRLWGGRMSEFMCSVDQVLEADIELNTEDGAILISPFGHAKFSYARTEDMPVEARPPVTKNPMNLNSVLYVEWESGDTWTVLEYEGALPGGSVTTPAAN